MGWLDMAATTLENKYIRLRPLVRGDRASLHSIAVNPSIWRYTVDRIETDADFDAYFEDALREHQAGRRAVFHITDKRSGRAAGSRSFCNMAEADSRLEIGKAWLGQEFQGRGINRWVDFLLMGHAFEQMKAERVEFKTHVLNQQARRALRNIGATEEGILRSYDPTPGGGRHDVVFFSILQDEWPSVKQRLTCGSRESEHPDTSA
ncbi:GNAT family N-acetyltransferase [Streptomyces sp. p1417]|uniref:GNAT family N-acetyltransferase n=1 Tax=Streptomyces typhae TaxID=2681492 RepID=A0A6L6WSD5_9ACTN|nr:GNAT family protein [Streptomyces typhae]MVO84973.1 GNAT family N-acetyltransferase [Streptomyces typhae]